MAQYSPKKIIRSISKPLLKRYFDGRGLLGDFDWSEYEQGDPKPIIEALVLSRQMTRREDKRF